MPKIIIAATIDFATQEQRDEAVRLTTPVQLATRNEEPGCLAYCFAADPAVPNRIQVYELWEDHASLAAHFKHHYYDRMRQILGSMQITGAWNQMYDVARHEPVYGPGGQVRERFFTDATA
jgi:quinol monooxygenase YgiN